MSLIDHLREAHSSVPPSHVPTANELAPLLGALLLHLEHGDEFLKAAEQGGHDGVSTLIQPPEPDRVAERQAAAEAEKQQLLARIAALEGSQGHPTVTVDEPPAPEVVH